ncbi:recombinase family protein [Chloroflexales bacterium ZM16-3]|nr:recombinase family protein [Chloroflexales bacterium ZM16-3]
MARTSTKIAAPVASPVRPALYLRVSTDEQAGSGEGMAVQRQQGMGMAMMKGWTEPRIYEDAGVSGTLGPKQRPGLAQLLADVKAGAISVVIVASLDRLGRSTRIILDLVDHLTEGGAELVSCRESLDTTTPAGKFVLTLFAALAQLDRDQIVKRTTDGRDSRGRRDGEKGGNVPLGYKRVDGTLLVDVANAAVVRRVFTLRPMFSLNSIAGTLNAEGVPTPHGGKAWYASTVRQILLNETIYRGSRRGESAASWPVILDGEVPSGRRRRHAKAT